MTQPGRQHRQPGLHVEPVAMPTNQGVHRERVAQPVDRGPAVLRSGPEPRPADQRLEHLAHALVGDAAAGRMDEQGRRARRGGQHGAPSQVGAQGRDRGGVDDDLPGLSELRLPDGDQALGQRHIGAVEPDGLTDAHPGHHHQPDEGLAGGSRQRPAGLPCDFEERSDVGFGVQIRVGPPPWRQPPSLRDLGGRVGGLQPGGEAPDDAQPHPQPRR